MKILYVHQLFSTRGGAVGTRSYEMARSMVAAGHQVTVVCGSYANADTGIPGPFVRGYREGVVDGITVKEFAVASGNKLSFPQRIRGFISFMMKSLKPVLRDDYDLIYATSTPLTVAVSGIAAKLLRRKRFVFEIRDLWPELPRAMGVIRNPAVLGAMSLLESAGYRVADACVGLSPGIVEGIQRKTGDSKPVLLAPNSADLDFFARNAQDARAIPGVAAEDVAAIFTGTHGIANGLENVLDAAAVLSRSSDPVAKRIKLVFVGDGNRKAALVERATREGLTNCVFLDPVPKTQLRSYLHRADIGIMALANVPAFYYGTSPNKFFDYLAASLPVVCNYPGWVSDLIEEHHCGLQAPPENPQMLADVLIEMARDPQRRAEMRANGRRLAEQRFDRRVIAGDLIAFLEKVADGR